MKTALKLFAFAIAALSAHAQVVNISPRLGDWGDPSGFAPFHIISAEQLPQHTLVVEASQSTIEEVSDHTAVWQFIAGYGCWFEDQFDIASFPNRDYDWLPPYAWFHSINNPCMFGFAPEPLPELNYFPSLSKEESQYRVKNSRGVWMMIGPEVLPQSTNGVRRFLGTPAN